jgi:hypothetical protein
VKRSKSSKDYDPSEGPAIERLKEDVIPDSKKLSYKQYVLEIITRFYIDTSATYFIYNIVIY